jgi:hypothetical protein
LLRLHRRFGQQLRRRAGLVHGRKSTGALFGAGIANGRAQWKMIRTIVAAWVLTLPMAALLSGVIYTLLRLIRIRLHPTDIKPYLTVIKRSELG